MHGDGRQFFLKTGHRASERFAAEADGLAALAACEALVVPRVVALGAAGDDDFLVVEWLQLDSDGDDSRLGEAIAALHAIPFERFGWHRDNFIGSTPQANDWSGDWPEFFATRRLAPQLRLAADRGETALQARATPILARLDRVFAGHAPLPSLCHGDLWAGNKGFVGGKPALFDPAVYAGDGETDLAMAELFGGFSPRFFAAYRAVRGHNEGADIRRDLYQLYHVLNHVNLFGGGYVGQAEGLIERLRRAVG